MINDIIILAGGSGTRLWPASTNKKPKQFLPLPGRAEGALTFFGAALERALALLGSSSGGRLIIVAGKNHVDPIVEECAHLPEKKGPQIVLIPEPMARNTAPAIACALMYIHLTSQEERTVMVLTSDHIIEPIKVFAMDVSAAAAVARTGKLAVFGISPQRPETGYGYIEAGAALPVPGKRARVKGYSSSIFELLSFREKPDLKKAKAFVAAKRYYWNSGMFVFTSSFMMKEFEVHSPPVIDPFKALGPPPKKAYKKKKGLLVLEDWAGLQGAYAGAQGISFDYAIAEKSHSAVMVRAGFDWIDVGGWDEYAALAGRGRAEVYSTGKGQTCFVDSDIPVALCGVEDLIVVVRAGKKGEAGAVLITKKGEAQGVKDLVDQIRGAGRGELL
ncbi:MAG: sugar phosphate nucleotidyltransferase [Treponema sp.]|nr:sugar phosphate nucleotidyltransferase [Treponema sp.]